MFVVSNTGTVSGNSYVIVRARPEDIPTHGTLRVLTGSAINTIWRFSSKAIAGGISDGTLIAIIGSEALSVTNGDVVQIMHEEYNSPCVRINFAENTQGQVSMQFQVGTLDVTSSYGANPEMFDQVKSFLPGYAVSAVYTQSSAFSGNGAQPTTNVPNFVVYDGGLVGGTEYWNELQIMQRGGQVWIWWNGLLIPPSPVLSAELQSSQAAGEAREITTGFHPRPGEMGFNGVSCGRQRGWG